MANKVSNQDLTQGSLWRQVLLVGVPLILSNILQITFNAVDVAVVGRFSGTLALGSVGSTSILLSTITSILIGLAGGITAMTARYVGARNVPLVRKTVHTALLLSLLIDPAAAEHEGRAAGRCSTLLQNLFPRNARYGSV